MKLDLQGAIGDAWRWWKRDRAVLLAISGVFIFLPQLAGLLFVPEQPKWPENLQDSVAMNDWVERAMGWLGTYGPALFVCDALAVYGALTIYVSYLHPARPDAGGALRLALRLFPRFLIAAMIVQTAFGLGLDLLVLPGLYIAGRTAMVGPIFAGEKPDGSIAAIRASIARTRGYGFVLTLLAAITILSGGIVGATFKVLGESLDKALLANPVSAVVIDVAIAASLSLGALAAILVHVSIYRRIGSPEG